MNVKHRTIAAVSIVILTLSGFFLFQGIRQHNGETARLLKEKEHHFATIVDDISRYSFLPYLTRIEHLPEAHPDIVKAFAARDRQLLYKLALDEYRTLRKENAYFHALDFNLPDGTVFLRVQNPELYGDNLLDSREILRHVHKSRQKAAGFDIGKHGAIYWIVQPLLYQGRYLGSMEFGIPARQITDALQKKLSCNVSLIVPTAAWKKANLIKDGFRDFGGYVLLTHDNPIFNQLPGGIDFNRQRQQVLLGNREYLIHTSIALKDFQAHPMGKIILLQDISRELAMKRQFIVRAAIIVALLLAVALAVVYLAINGLVGRLEQCARDSREAREELQNAHHDLEIRVRTRTNELADANAVLQEEISERQQAEKKITEQREFLQNIIESLTNPFYVIDADTHAIVLANQAAYSLTDRPRQNLTCHAMTHDRDQPCTGDEHVCALAVVKKTRQPAMVEHIHTDHQGGPRNYEIYAYPIFDRHGEVKQVIEYNIDITERKKTEEEKKKMWAQLLQSQKMEAVGVLAGGVAHDFNNILTAIIGNVQLAMLKGGEAVDSIRGHLEQIGQSSNRAAGLVRQLLLFSRRQVIEDYVPVDFNQTIHNILNMLKRLIGEDVTISVELMPGIWKINADEGNLEQMITNLVVNARDAMPEGGEIVITTKNLGIDEDLEKQITNSRIGRYVLLSIADTGTGIAPGALPKIFEPFFTTKPAGKGTGLGLSIVSGIVEQHGGWINAYSDVGRGTIFNIYLPAINETLPIKQTEEREEHRRQTLTGDHRLVLLLEDENEVREITRRILEERGFKVLAVADIAAARNAFAAERDNIALLFSDVALPDGNGVKLAMEFLTQMPELKVLLTSGYPDHRSRLGIIREKKLRFIQKPYGLAELDQAIRGTLEG
ncbi:MAG: ATP-binding protein [Desulfobulbaceae bacterium]|nr:ATP-binding protein [Desulfobulbaceae bacterium]